MTQRWPEYECRDEAVVPAPPEQVWPVVTDLTTWGAWWHLVRVTPLGDETTLTPGTRFRIEGGRPGGATSRAWTVEVLEVDAPRVVEMAYTEGDLVGRVAWEMAPAEGGAATRVAYVYHGVRPTNAASAETFERYGTGLHSVAMQVDALAGLARHVRGEPLDAAWHDEVRGRMADGVAALD